MYEFSTKVSDFLKGLKDFLNAKSRFLLVEISASHD
jgi:hypothetical protein